MTSTRYEITVEGHLDRGRWSRWFEGMDVGFREDGKTTISGPVVDQAVLHGVLARVRDLGIVLSFVQRAEEARPTQSTSATFAVVAGLPTSHNGGQETKHNPRTGMHNAAAQDIQGS